MQKIGSRILLLIFLVSILIACAQKKPPTLSVRQEVSTLTRSERISIPTITIQSLTETIDPTRAAIIEEIASGKEQATLIIAATEKYFQTTGAYPDHLVDLVPSFLEEIPLTITGQEFSYQMLEDDIYVLSFNLSSEGLKEFTRYCAYLRKQDIWECGITHP